MLPLYHHALILGYLRSLSAQVWTGILHNAIRHPIQVDEMPDA